MNPMMKIILNNKAIVNNRKCLVTNQVFPKSSLIRIVKLKDGTILLNSNALGRGAYINKNCVDYNLIKQKKVLNRVFKTNVDNKVYDNLIKILKGVQDDKKR